MDSKMKKRIESARFAINNGRIMRVLNILYPNYHSLKSIELVLNEDGVGNSEFIECVNYLVEEGYIKMRDVTSGYEVKEMSQYVHYAALEAKLTPKGTRLLQGMIEDSLVEV